MIEMPTHALVVLSVFITLFLVCEGNGLIDVHITPVPSANELPDSFSYYQLTSEHIRLRVKRDPSDGAIHNCSISRNVPLQNKQQAMSEKVTVSYNEWESLLHQCTQLTKDYQTLTQLQDRYTSEPHRRKREVKPSGRTTIKPTYIPEGNKLGNVFILNGTNWCGTGNQARSFDDLGFYEDIDKCCRSHDYCKHFIPMFTTKYGYSNSRPYTISFCECDYDFYSCLKTVGDAKADEVGDLFFHTIGVPCFNFEYGEYCKDKSSFLFCSKGYELGDTVTLNYVLSDIWYQDETRARLP